MAAPWSLPSLITIIFVRCMSIVLLTRYYQYGAFALGSYFCTDGNVSSIDPTADSAGTSVTTGRGGGPGLLPFWSWGFSRSCCQVYPDSVIKPPGSFFEHGQGRRYFNHPGVRINHGDAVYVATSDLPTFIDTFTQLPASFRIVLVTGSEDIGAPYEIFHPDRPNFFVRRSDRRGVRSLSRMWPLQSSM
jgi:hypothetical protein